MRWSFMPKGQPLFIIDKTDLRVLSSRVVCRGQSLWTVRPSTLLLA
jgi:hypothetical protein